MEAPMWRSAQTVISRIIMGLAFGVAGAAAITWWLFVLPNVVDDLTTIHQPVRLLGLSLFGGLMFGCLVLIPIAWVAEFIDPELRDEKRAEAHGTAQVIQAPSPRRPH